jgi:uncharacterized protein
MYTVSRIVYLTPGAAPPCAAGSANSADQRADRPALAALKLSEAPGGRLHRAVRRPFAEVPTDARQYAIRTRDGVLLATDVYLPAARGRWPVLLCRLPFDKAGEECFLPLVARWLNERGYAVVVQDVRGKVRSGGALAPFAHEVPDGFDTIEWVAAQRWSTGAVGMFGDSFYGFTQWAAAASGHPALRAIAPRAAAPDYCRSRFHQGVLLLEMTAGLAFEAWIDEALYDCVGGLDWTVRPLADIVARAHDGRRPVALDDLALGRAAGAAPSGRVGTIPALHLAGYWDPVHRDTIAGWRRACTAGRAPQYLVLDTTDHCWTELREPGAPFDDPFRSQRAMAGFLDGYLGPLVPFFDGFLREASGPHVAPVRWRLAKVGWFEGGRWPPAGSRPAVWTLSAPPDSGTGQLVPGTGRVQLTGAVEWPHDPGDPVPSLVHPWYQLVDPPDEAAGPGRPDVASFVSDPLTAPLDLAGPAQLVAWIESSAPSTHLFAKVLDLAPDGTARRVMDGAAAVAGPWPARVALLLGHAGYRMLAGHALRLDLASSAFPRYELHPGTSATPWTATQFARSEQRLLLGGAPAPTLQCFVLPGGAAL